MTDSKGPPKRPSGTYRAVLAQARRVAEAFVCTACGPDGVRCARAVGHDGGADPTPHRGEGEDAYEWT